MKLIKKLELKANHLISKAPDSVYNIARIIRTVSDKTNIEINFFLDKQFICIYQNGRVASTSVFESISLLDLPNPVFHVHSLVLDRVEDLKRKNKLKSNKIDRNLFVGTMLGEKVLEKRHRQQGNKWKIITIFREPISTMISILFLNAQHYFSNFIDPNGDVDKERILADIQKTIITDDPSGWSICTWFEDEFEKALGIDVYNYPFDHQNGFTIIKEKMFDVLLLKFEDLNSTFNKGISQLFDISEDSVKLLKSNVHKNEEYAPIHKYVLNNLIVPKSVSQNIYSLKYIKHFYSQEMIERLIEKWSKPR